MSNQWNHPYHLVNYSPWPLLGAISSLMLTSGLVKWFWQLKTNLLLLAIMTTLMVMYQWWRDVSRESSFQGLHSIKVINGLKWGMILFIISEIFFFFSFFWSFFHVSLSSSIELGMNWPPINIKIFNPFQIPLLNTLILLTSGITITWSHHSILENKYNKTEISLMLTIMLGIYFSLLQLYEYNQANFTMADSSYGSSFFLTTGFHGLHVLIGTTFLLVCLIRHKMFLFSYYHHFGFEAAAWYWHFVDVVWLFLFISMYWWNS